MKDWRVKAQRGAQHARLLKRNPSLMAALYGTPSYACPKCGAVSFNPNDIANRYCGACHKFEDDR